MKKTSIHEIVAARAAFAEASMFLEPGTVARIGHCWTGVCQEVLEGLAGLNGHRVTQARDGRLLVWRDGYTAPHFVQLGTAFCCPYWG